MPKVTLEHRTARQDQIVAAARRCAMEQGFHKTTMADVIRESGLSAGAVYGYFKSKDEIVSAIADQALSTVDELFERIMATEQPLTPLTALKTTLEHIVTIAEQPDGDITRVALQAWAEAMHNDAIAAIAREKYTHLRGKFTEVARRAQADGTIDPDADPNHIGQVMFAVLPGFLLQRLILGDVTPQSFTAGLTALLK
jgi:AcrR family transcriptional regulator